MSDKKDSKLVNFGIIILFIIFGIFALMSIMLLFFTLGIANEAKQSMPVIEEIREEFVYNERSYYLLSETERAMSPYIDFSDLDIETLKFSHYDNEIEKEVGIKCWKEYNSMIDNIENPTVEYTIHYDLWYSKYKFFVDRKEKAILESYDGDIVATELDYGRQNAYWLGEQLVIRFNDKNLLIFHSDTTEKLLKSKACADFIRTEMHVSEPLNIFDLLSL